MRWLAENWVWVAVAIGIALLLRFLRKERAIAHAGGGVLQSPGSEVPQAGHLAAAHASKAPEAATDAASGQTEAADQPRRRHGGCCG